MYARSHLDGLFHASNKTSNNILTSVSINRSQAAALAEGFLDDIGTDSIVLQPRTVFTEIFLLAGELIEDAQKNLNQTNSNASGGLSRSLEAQNPREEGQTVMIDIVMAEHGNYVNKGVKGTKSGMSKAGYSFRNENPSPAMLKNLSKSINRAGRSTRNTNARKTKSKNEIKNAATSKAKVWGAAVNIKRYGIKPTGFLDLAVEKTESKIADRLQKALEIDIYNSI